MAEGKYAGQAKCKACHSMKKHGEMHGIWKRSLHARAYQTLLSPEAKAIAEARGLGDPAKEKDCLRCHVSAHDVKAERIQRGFKIRDGVQCETCHGPGADHVRLRQKDLNAPAWRPELSRGEIRLPSEKDCRACHNPDSPTFEAHGFDFAKALGQIRHLHPQRKAPRVQAKVKKPPAAASPPEKEGG